MGGALMAVGALHPQPHPALIASYLKWLKLPAIAAAYQDVARDAEKAQVGYLSYLEALLDREFNQRQDRSQQQRLIRAHFPYAKRLEDFDFAALPNLEKTAVFNLAHGHFVKERQNLLIVGPSGLGKTHLLIGIGRALCQRGYKVLFRTAAALATELELAQRELRLPKLLTQFRRFDLILVDELGYLPFSQTAAELLFQFFADRYERASVGLTTNLDFAHWTEVFGHEQMTAALLDRLVHRSTILSVIGESYRFRHSLATLHQREQPERKEVVND
jgi:DNA replication protein DnaC